MGLNSLALGFNVDFFTWSITPSVRSDVSDLTSSLPGVLAGCGVAGEFLSEMFAAVAGEDVVSLVASSAGAGEGCDWSCEGLEAAG